VAADIGRRHQATSLCVDRARAIVENADGQPSRQDLRHARLVLSTETGRL
jgi:hypothetical protein